ncbi:AraC family transcriptional regulator [Microbispora rosea subsp. aerata]|nr:Ada metal-binding domain-containing protein [Microbispora rosea]GGO18188.1 AraC family transcriptional regulator [Microbispora rosea subsp. aerata]GIH56703.1 AraC family transcriptional regulator [Microbispora rosea subsp. aerata]GLJ82076.1 AraC family transcriptional regulator [Microbispora rosea subsp. aerata]
MTTRQLDFDACYRAVSARDPRFDGRFYTAVTTTGIYCRPICPARTPARSNVRFYRHAAAAEAAGFRPCRRCRPELSPGDPGWDVRADLVGRALRLIDDGVADESGVAGLARRLHVTERHLHRLFVAELGTGPLAVARTRRLLLAKQLLTETTLPITDVAFASGFGSVRQFNAAMRESYGFAPGELRKAGVPLRGAGVQVRGAKAPAALTTGLTLRLGHREPYDAQAVLRFLAARAIPSVEAVSWSGSDVAAYTRAVPGGWITLRPAAGHVRLTVRTTETHRLSRLVARCRRLLDLDADPGAVREVLGATSLAPLVTARPGLRVPGAYDGFELAVRAIVGQQISVAGARTLLGRITARAGPPAVAAVDAADAGMGARDGKAARAGAREAAPMGANGTEAALMGAHGTEPDAAGQVPLLFPAAERLADADLDGLGLTTRRVATIRALAEAVASGEIDLDGAGDPADTVARLLEIPGIGPWTAGYIALRALRDPDAWPEGDLVLRRTMERLGIAPDETERWRPWRAYAALHLWNHASAI